MACMFFTAGYFMKTIPTMQPAFVFAALFAIGLGARHAGEAAAFGPDMGKSKAGFKRIFDIIDYPS